MKRTDYLPIAGTLLALAVLTGAAPVATSNKPGHGCCQDGQATTGNTVVNTQNVSYGTDPAQKLDVYRPSTAGASTRYPSIIIVHGGGWSMFDQAGTRDVSRRISFSAATTWSSTSTTANSTTRRSF
jgi:acetyl esterase/lipase